MMVYGKTTEDIESRQVMPAGHKSSGSWFWKLCSVLSLMAVCAVLALLFTWHIQKQEQRLTERPVNALSGQPEVHAAQQIMLKQIADKVKAGIHVEGSVNQDHFKSSVEWSVIDGHSFVQGDLILQENKIIIPYTGLYFVYSQASFRVSCSTTDGSQQPWIMALSHTVMRYSASYDGEKPLLSTVKSPCAGATNDIDTSGQVFSSIYLGAVFKLRHGDQLWTDTNRLQDVDTDEGKTFFGVFAL